MSGPAAHPLFGNFMTMSELDQVPYRAFDFLTQRHGPIVRLVFGPSILVILGGYREIKDAMNNELLDDRESSPTADLIRDGLKRGLVMMETLTHVDNGNLKKKAKNWLELKDYGWFGMIFENIQSDPPKEVRGQS